MFIKSQTFIELSHVIVVFKFKSNKSSINNNSMNWEKESVDRGLLKNVVQN